MAVIRANHAKVTLSIRPQDPFSTLSPPRFDPVSPETSAVYPKEHPEETHAVFDGSPNEYCSMTVSRNRGSDEELIRVIGGVDLCELKVPKGRCIKDGEKNEIHGPPVHERRLHLRDWLATSHM